MLAIIDYDAGNIKSVIKAFEALGENPVLIRRPSEILGADRLILPGVGNFGDCMKRLRDYELTGVIKEATDTGIPFLGICLGHQLIFDRSEEAPGVEGLSLLHGDIKKLPAGSGLKIPNIGWNSLDLPGRGRLFEGIREGAYVYFVHSYYLEAKDPGIVTATTEYGALIHASVESGNIFGCQFHPEKSSSVGLKILENFLKVK